MDSIKCQALLLAIQYGSLTAAGKELGYTQSGMTRMIRSLEKEIGFPLLVRNKQGVRPSANGQQMVPAFQEVVRASQKAADCCLAAKPGADVAYDWIPLKDDELVVWLPPDHPWTAEKEIPVEWLNGAPFIIPLPDHDTDIDRFLAANQVQPDVRFTTTDPYTAYCMVEEGLGISVNNRLTTEKWAGRVELRPLAPAQSISLGIAVPDIQEMSPAAGKFVAQVWQAVNGSPEK